MSKSVVVNHQELYLLSIPEWNALLDNGEYCNIKMIEVYRNKLDFDVKLSQRYDELVLVLGFIRDENWLPYMLLKIDSGYQRISIENRGCSICNWEGLVGITNIINLYIGVPINMDKFDFIRKASELEKKNCPKCKKDGFKEQVIWVENIEKTFK